MSNRAYSYYDDQQFIDLGEAAKARGMTISSFQKFATLLLVYKDESKRNSTASIPQLLVDMQTALDDLPSGQVFVTSSLFDPEVWTNLSASDKRTLSCSLKKIIDDNKSSYRLISRIPGKINQYEKM